LRVAAFEAQNMRDTVPVGMAGLVIHLQSLPARVPVVIGEFRAIMHLLSMLEAG